MKRILLILILLLIGCSQQYLRQDEYKFIIVGLPDTQHYSADHPEIFNAQTQWIVDSKDSIDYVVHLGDVVQSWDKINEWENAKEALLKLDGEVPYMIIPGNHDGLVVNDMSNFKKYISPKLNDYTILSKSGNGLLIMGLQWNPDSTTLQWANDILYHYSYIPTIVFTHEYLDINGQRSKIGDFIWDNLISKHLNIFLVMNGHFRYFNGLVAKIDTIDGHLIHQHLYNYQHFKNGGNGWLRIYTIERKQIYVKTYSPYLREYKQDECFAFGR